MPANQFAIVTGRASLWKPIHKLPLKVNRTVNVDTYKVNTYIPLTEVAHNNTRLLLL